MERNVKFFKFTIIVVFIIGITLLIFSSEQTTTLTDARSNGSPSARTGAPGESSCTSCHNQTAGPGQIQVIAPSTYTPGQPIQISVTASTTDTGRSAWGFQLTALDATNTKAGTLAATTGNTTVINSSTRQYMNQTNAGTFVGQVGGATWTFNWTPPASNVGPITFYTAGLLADNSEDDSGDRTVLGTAVIQAAVPTPTPSPTPTPLPPGPTRFDFDSDGRADLSIFRPSNNVWHILRGTAGYISQEFGIAGDVMAPADFDGDGRTEIAVFRPSTGTWYWYNLANNNFTMVQWGAAGDLPVPADHDGDGKADLVLYRPSNGTWYKRLSTSTGIYSDTFSVFQFGTGEDKPQIGDFDGDGKSDLALFRPSNNNWYFYRTTAGFGMQTWGAAGDMPVPADFDGDGRTDVATFRPSTGGWYIVKSSNNAITVGAWGVAGDKPVPADYDGDGKVDPAVFRPSNSTWYMLCSTAGIMQQTYGQTGDTPAENAFAY